MSRRYSIIDTFIIESDHLLRTVFSKPQAVRPNPAKSLASPHLNEAETRHAAGLMRVDHTGEICAQALYRGQALVAKSQETKLRLLEAAIEENDHLAWCQDRIDELQSHPSYLNPFWYAASFYIGIFAGLAGDKWSLGFVAETEHQVMQHLDEHLSTLPEADHKSRCIIEHMHLDEAAHATHALKQGGRSLPAPIRLLMKAKSKLMTQTAYWI